MGTASTVRNSSSASNSMPVRIVWAGILTNPPSPSWVMQPAGGRYGRRFLNSDHASAEFTDNKEVTERPHPAGSANAAEAAPDISDDNRVETERLHRLIGEFSDTIMRRNYGSFLTHMCERARGGKKSWIISRHARARELDDVLKNNQEVGRRHSQLDVSPIPHTTSRLPAFLCQK